MKILITGGHLTPAIAVIEKLKNAQVLYAGRKYSLEGDNATSLEYQTVPKLGVKFIEVNPPRFQRKLSRNTIPAMLRVPQGLREAFGILKDERPDALLCFGGYVQIPFVLASVLLKIPIVLHEQTFEAGASNRLCSKFAKTICISHDSSAKYFPKNKTILTGNPVRREIFETQEKINLPQGSGPLIFVTGGSQGSHFINELIKNNLEELLRNYRIIHQTGDAKQFNDFEDLLEKKKTLENLAEKYIIFRFINPSQIGFVLKNSDLVIGRGGANTVWEIFLLKKRAIIIPISFSQKQEQLKNANFLKESGMGLVLSEENSSREVLMFSINDMIKNESKYRLRNEHEIPKDPAEKIIKALKNAIKTKNNKIQKENF